MVQPIFHTGKQNTAQESAAEKLTEKTRESIMLAKGKHIASSVDVSCQNSKQDFALIAAK